MLPPSGKRMRFRVGEGERAGRITPHARLLGLAAGIAVLGAGAPVSAMAGPTTEDAAVETPEVGDGDEARQTVDSDDPSPEQLEKAQHDVRVEEATHHYVEGQALFDRGQYLEAAAEFERSYAAIPAAATLEAIALSYERAGKTIQAIRAYARYLALPDCDRPGADPLACAQPDKREEAVSSLEKLRRFVGELHLDIAPGVELREVRVGGRVVPLEDFPVLLMPGPIDVELYGKEPDDQRVRVPRIAPGEQYRLSVEPFGSPPSPRVDPGDEPRSSDPDPVRDPARDLRRQQILRGLFWTGLGVTLAAGASTGALGGLMLREKAKFEDRCTGNCVGQGESYPFGADERFHDLRTATNAMIGVTAALGVTTAVLGIFAFSRGDAGSPQRASVRLTGTGLTVHW